jgi:hypothetical protein
MQPYQIGFLERAANEASQANQSFPEHAACEAALESPFGMSKLASEDNSLFRMKQHSNTPVFETVVSTTTEFVDGQRTNIDAFRTLTFRYEKSKPLSQTSMALSLGGRVCAAPRASTPHTTKSGTACSTPSQIPPRRSKAARSPSPKPAPRLVSSLRTNSGLQNYRLTFTSRRNSLAPSRRSEECCSTELHIRGGFYSLTFPGK